jgi:predicted Co/Zn/Cd cation transporter (cation efflux family)
MTRNHWRTEHPCIYYYYFVMPLLIILVFILASMVHDLVVNGGANLVLHLAVLVSIIVVVFGWGVSHNGKSINRGVRGPLDDPD